MNILELSQNVRKCVSVVNAHQTAFEVKDALNNQVNKITYFVTQILSPKHFSTCTKARGKTNDVMDLIGGLLSIGIWLLPLLNVNLALNPEFYLP